MPRHFPILRIVVPAAAVATGVSLVSGVVAAVVLMIIGIAGGQVVGGLINGIAAAAAGILAAFIAAAIGEAAELLLDLHDRLRVPEHLDQHLVGEGRPRDVDQRIRPVDGGQHGREGAP